jgi:hypothetical protein
MSRLLIFLALATVILLGFEWLFTHFGLVVLGAGGWWMWSQWEGRRNA